MSGTVILERQGMIATLTLSNPGKMNGVSLAMWQQLRSHCESLSADTSLRCVIVRGADANFAAGGDIAEFPTVRNGLAQIQRYHNEMLAPALHALAHCLHPTIAMIEGVCMGGGLEIASQCDIRVAADNARFGAPINRLGFAMAPLELAAVLRVANPAVMAEILLEGRIYSAQDALAHGLVSRVVPALEIESDVAATASRIGSGAPLAARANKQMLRRLQNSTPLSDDEIQQSMSYWADSQDHHEGVQAFIEKRKPQFVGQ